ncbi:Protein of unknown function [Granulicella rosea]|uniref:DUF2961 domain-containing protein n=1 Tax=Granulicella rosea TaxID=474952 RepID=A0A239MEF2_9BACT|nr:DUF2961 domain-containing protein [Granulicella rosea]SNT40512.1 Protein of unknown function [Granulicella rosea]
MKTPLSKIAPDVVRSKLPCFLLIAACGICRAQQAQSPLPVGLDAYRQWDRWPEQRIGMRAYMRSTYDRAGGNEGVDASHFLRQVSDTVNVTLDLQSPGLLVFSRYNHWHGSPWHFVVDGKDHIVAETNTADPNKRVASSSFLPSAPFPSPLNETWTTTRGADLMWSPIAFERSFQMAYGRTKYGTGYYIYDLFAPGAALSHPLQSWNEHTVPTSDVLDLLRSAGADIAPKPDARRGVVEQTGILTLFGTNATPVASLKGPSTLRVLTFSIPEDQAAAFEKVRLRATWDGRSQPSIDVPVALFYGAGTLYNREKKEYLVKALPVSIRFHKGRVELACYFPMPFFRSARIELVGAGEPIRDVRWTTRTMPLGTSPTRSSYFHATYRDIPTPTPGEDMVLLDTRQAEDASEWSGSFIGTSFIFSHAANLTTLEGDPRFFFDDSQTPQAQGTGTEEWGGGGDYWGGENMTLALAGHPVGAKQPSSAVSDADRIESAYRFLLADLFPFGKNAVIRLEHGGENQAVEHYETIAYWYGLPSPSIAQTDKIQIGDEASEKAHAYNSPAASAPYEIRSRFELGPDTLRGGKVVYPASTDTGRTTTGVSEFDLQLRKDNQGVLLRRKLDYSYPDQRAEVSIETAPGRWSPAGVWYLAGSNTVVYSNPKEELGATEHTIRTSNRRFREDEILLPVELTRGRDRIRVRVKFMPLNDPLFPGHPLAPQAWSEINYTAWCFITPKTP